MMKRLTTLIITFIVTLTSFCQSFLPNNQSNKNLNFSTFINGVRYAYVVLDENNYNLILNFPKGPNAQAVSGIVEYLKFLGFNEVSWGKSENIPNKIPSFCDYVIIIPSWDYKNATYYNIKISFVSCNLDTFEFISDRYIENNGLGGVKTAFYNRCLKMYGLKLNNNLGERLKLPSEITKWNENELKKDIQNNGAEEIEGIYESLFTSSSMPKYKLGVRKIDEKYKIIYLNGADNFEDWIEGEIKSELIYTASSNLFKASWKMANKSVNTNSYVSFEKGLMNVLIEGSDKQPFVKLYPSFSDNISENKIYPASGTGFGITSDGIIVTNSHVVNGSKKITVRGVNGDFSKSYSAVILVEDKKNDLALLKIYDSTFVSLGTIPYKISTKSSDVGSSVYTLGYPLKALLGDEVKLTTGVISSKTGYQGDVTLYQISVPLQPGNSGGPIYDKNGDLIGIANSKLANGENVSYAVKSSYLINLLELLPSAPSLSNESLTIDKTLPEQVKILNRFVYVIDVN